MLSPKERIEFIERPAGTLAASTLAAGTLESCIQEPPHPINKIGIMCHPHPLHGGTMNNKVVTTLTRVFRDLDMINIRFNFRGVGKSTGTFDEGIGETDDALAIIKWAQKCFPGKEIFLAGFSFGAYVSLRAAAYTKLSHLISIAPAVKHAPFLALKAPTCPWSVVIAEDDQIAPAKDTYQWINTLRIKPEILSFPHTSHFFDGKLLELREQLVQRLKDAHAL